MTSAPSGLKLRLKIGGNSLNGPTASTSQEEASPIPSSPTSSELSTSSLSSASDSVDNHDNVSNPLDTPQYNEPISTERQETVERPMQLDEYQLPMGPSAFDEETNAETSGAVTMKPSKRKKSLASNASGPGKHWRKGMKGYQHSPASTSAHSNAKESSSKTATASTHTLRKRPDQSALPPLPPVPTSRPFPVAQFPKVSSSTFLPPQPLELRTPKPRAWKRKQRAVTTISGLTLHVYTWEGNELSNFAESRRQREFDKLGESIAMQEDHKETTG